MWAGLMTAPSIASSVYVNLTVPLRLMQNGRLPAIGVTDSQLRLVGLVTSENIAEMMMILAANPKRSARMPWQRISAR
jgi:CBS-domain-containing membrane protein